MARSKKHTPLLVYLNNKLVGRLTKKVTGSIEFSYDTQWLSWEHAIPTSLSMPLREEVYKGDVVLAVFENLLPDSGSIRSRVAERVGAQGIDFYNLLSEIGKDCVGAFAIYSGEYYPSFLRRGSGVKNHPNK
jgi:serine/threonine-protein kinase HipA